MIHTHKVSQQQAQWAPHIRVCNEVLILSESSPSEHSNSNSERLYNIDPDRLHQQPATIKIRSLTHFNRNKIDSELEAAA